MNIQQKDETPRKKKKNPVVINLRFTEQEVVKEITDELGYKITTSYLDCHIL
jgi:hypothetical protein